MLKDSESFRDKLLKELEKVGIEYIDELIEYRVDIWAMRCLWKSEDEIKILWHKNFTEDASFDGDNFAEFVVNGNVIGVIEIKNLLNQKLEIPLNSEIFNRFKRIAGRYTGKVIK